MSHLPDSGMDTKMAILQGQMQALSNEFRYSSQSQGERLGKLETDQKIAFQEIGRLHTKIEVWGARLTIAWGAVSFGLILVQLWLRGH